MTVQHYIRRYHLLLLVSLLDVFCHAFHMKPHKMVLCESVPLLELGSSVKTASRHMLKESMDKAKQRGSALYN